MTAKVPKLRAVRPDEKVLPAKPKSLIDAVAGGDYLEILLAQRREIAESIPDEKGPAKAALHRQLSIIAKEIEALEARSQEEAEDVEDGGDEDWDSEVI